MVSVIKEVTETDIVKNVIETGGVIIMIRNVVPDEGLLATTGVGVMKADRAQEISKQGKKLM